MITSQMLILNMNKNCVFGCVGVGRGGTPTWCEEAVEVTDDCAERGSERGLVVHAAGDQICQFCPLWCRKMVVILIEQDFL